MLSLLPLKKKVETFPVQFVSREFVLRQPEAIMEEEFVAFARTVDELLEIDLQRSKEQR
jgi:hypothetical protein